MINFIEAQMKTADRLYQMMERDHNERIKDMSMWSEASYSLLRKLEQRDKEIIKLRAEIAALKAASAL
jgi:SMC interacting uncharacterized protein involved in chromosome segregation